MSDFDQETQPHHHHVTIDERDGFDIGPVDWVLAFLTMPLLFWALMYAVTGGEGIFATRAARYRLYAVLLVLEVLIVALLVWWFTR
ncbi:MAG: hypothetical protein KDC46_15890 [Thermoleophilia bacterium]|nr:hypothetical protein [Thermoleophilia bacterium]